MTDTKADDELIKKTQQTAQIMKTICIIGGIIFLVILLMLIYRNRRDISFTIPILSSM